MEFVIFIASLFWICWPMKRTNLILSWIKNLQTLQEKSYESLEFCKNKSRTASTASSAIPLILQIIQKIERDASSNDQYASRQAMAQPFCDFLSGKRKRTRMKTFRWNSKSTIVKQAFSFPFPFSTLFYKPQDKRNSLK